MEEKRPILWTTATQELKMAALLPQQRSELISRALEYLLTCIPAIGTALIWPCRNKNMPWSVYYAGIRHRAMHRWLSAHLTPSFEVMVDTLQHDLMYHLSDMPSFLLTRLYGLPSSPCGLWIVWTVAPLTEDALKWIERVRQILEALLEVEVREEHYFSTDSPLSDQALITSLAHGDAHAMSVLLGLTRLVAKADFTFWGGVHHDVVEITGQLGAKHSGFGFILPYGHGVGGRVAASGEPIVPGDYRNSPYRDPGVCDIVDREQIRSGMALPIRYTVANGTGTQVAAVLYATRRTANPFSLAEYLLVQRLARTLEPWPLEKHSVSFSVPDIKHIEQKEMWYDLILHATRIEVLETWVSQLIKGVVIVTDSDGHPYVFAHTEQVEQLRAPHSHPTGAVLALSLAVPGVQQPGQIYLCPSISLPPPLWPDFFADVVLACNVIITRMQQQQDLLARQREQWIRVLLQGKPSQYVEQDGYRLGLPVEHGQLWVLAWPPETMTATKAARQRMVAESIVLVSLKSPLIFWGDTIAVVLLEEQVSQSPSKVRDALLKHCGIHPLWIVYGTRYHSLQDLKMALTNTIAIAHKAQQEAYGEYLLDIYAFGLDSLLENPRLAADLEAFARKLLTPLIEYDTTSGSHLTETFVLAQTLGSAQAVAEQLAVHINTIRYRLRHVKEILGTEQVSPKENAALTLAAFIWQHFHQETQDHN